MLRAAVDAPRLAARRLAHLGAPRRLVHVGQALAARLGEIRVELLAGAWCRDVGIRTVAADEAPDAIAEPDETLPPSGQESVFP